MNGLLGSLGITMYQQQWQANASARQQYEAAIMALQNSVPVNPARLPATPSRESAVAWLDRRVREVCVRL